jgi:hypothetical protein
MTSGGLIPAAHRLVVTRIRPVVRRHAVGINICRPPCDRVLMAIATCHRAEYVAASSSVHPTHMTTTLPIKSMSQAEKLRAMEELWIDLSHTDETIETPSWHLAELAATEAEIASGNVGFLDWEQCKQSLRERTR